MDEEALRALAEAASNGDDIAYDILSDGLWSGSVVLELLDRVKALEGIEQERTALLVNEQNLREELEALKGADSDLMLVYQKGVADGKAALRAAMGEPVAWVGQKDIDALAGPEIDWATAWNRETGANPVALYALTNKDQA
jgi:hypothetical protein